MDKKILLKHWQAVSPDKWKFFGVIFVATISTILSNFITPLTIAKLLGEIQKDTITMSSAWPIVLLFFITQFLGEVVGWNIVLRLLWVTETRTQERLYYQIYNKLIKHSMRFHAENFGGSLVSQTNKLISSSERLIDTIVFQITPLVASILGSVIILAYIFWQLAVIILLFSLIFLFTVYSKQAKLRHLNQAESQASTATTGHIADSVTNILAIKSHNNQDKEQKILKNKLRFWIERSMDNMHGFIPVRDIFSSILVILNSSVFLVAIFASQKNMISIPVIYLAVTYSFAVSRNLWQANSIMRSYNRIIGDSYDMVRILNKKVEIKDPKNPEKINITRGEIVFENVDFAYADQPDKLLFKNLNLKIKAGEKVGLVGLSGGGKTTITKLIMRFSDIQNGTIAIDGQNIRNVKQSDLRGAISYVPQEPLLFHRSIEKNIAYGRYSATNQEIIAVAKMANAHGFISKLKDEYQTLVGERGVKLSGGQRQRIVIARAMLKNASVLLLDEATSALDSESENLIQDALWKLMNNKTAIVIAHRLSTIQKMDRIIVLDNGKIIEEGSHKELIYKNGKYAELWNRQSGGFVNED